MTAIHIREPALTIRAGRRAMQRLRETPLSPEDVHVIPGAAGGPKALGISGLDKAIFGDWLPRVPQERSLIGSSIGSWRFAAVASSDDPKAQLARNFIRNSEKIMGVPKTARKDYPPFRFREN